MKKGVTLCNMLLDLRKRTYHCRAANAPVFPLACIGNAASYSAGSVVPGELVWLFGNGLGPLTGVQLSASEQTPFPTQATGVQVTFDGKPAPLTWVQDSQVNVAVP
jgi:hypothetical protein